MKCKPRMLAIIIRDEFEENIGRIVRVLGPARWDIESDWCCEVEGYDMPVIDMDSGIEFRAFEADFSDACLLPVEGDALAGAAVPDEVMV